MATKVKGEIMATVSYRLPELTRLRMRGYDFINWSTVIRDLLNQKLDQLDREQWAGNLKGEKSE